MMIRINFIVQYFVGFAGFEQVMCIPCIDIRWIMNYIWDKVTKKKKTSFKHALFTYFCTIMVRPTL